MNPVTHLLVGWTVANASGLEKRRDRFLVSVAGIIPDLDGLGSPIFSKEFGNTVRDYMAMQKQKGGGTTAPMKPKRPASLDATMEGGATFGLG